MSADQQVYFDASALVKLVIQEAESPALESWLGQRIIVSCALARTKVVRAVADRGRDGILRARRLLDRIDLIQLDDELLDLAAQLDALLRSLDAIHVAAVLELGDALEALVTYDARVAAAATALGVPVASPGL